MALVMVSYGGFESIEQASGWLERCRWYGDKGRKLEAARSAFAVETDSGHTTLSVEVVELRFSTGTPSSYVLLRDPSDVGADQIEDPEVRAWLLSGFQEERLLPGSGGQLRWSMTDPGEDALASFAGNSRVFRGEQSNSSIIFDERVMVKLFRKVQPGENPEVEIGRHLTTNTDFRAFPKLLGSITLDTGRDSTTIAAAQEFICSKGDAWSWVLDGLATEKFTGTTLEAAGILGRRTAEMHAALATGTEEAFVPALIDEDYAVAIYEESLRELDDTVAQLEAHQVDDALHLGESLKRSLADLRLLQGTYRTRIHGDYHLGQVLRTNDEDFAILDFEGEPSRSLEERRAKASPLRDVAGMLHSFDYVAEAARRRYPQVTSDSFASLRVSARQAFTTGYTASVNGSEDLAKGLDPQRRHLLIAAFEVHKALYQARYELRNRPDWLEIQLTGLRRLAGTDP